MLDHTKQNASDNSYNFILRPARPHLLAVHAARVPDRGTRVLRLVHTIGTWWHCARDA